jgi:hypothetical protein
MLRTDTVTEPQTISLVATSGSLLDQPQRLGIVPTWSFWRGENGRLVRVPSAIAGGTLVVALGLSGLPWFVVGPLGAAAYTLLLGALERYLRHGVRQRRLAALGDSNASVGDAG